jgi:hypothetical protein
MEEEWAESTLKWVISYIGTAMALFYLAKEHEFNNSEILGRMC